METVRPRSRLKEHHKHLFQRNNGNGSGDRNNTTTTSTTLLLQDKILNDLARVVCTAGVVCRKEFLETLAAATAIHAHVLNNNAPRRRRMADVAAGHGLLAWFLLVLDLYEDRKYDTPTSTRTTATPTIRQQQRPHRTVVCLDRRMPPAATAIATAMLDHFPQLRDRWTYLEADVSAVEPHPSCLLVSVHACGTLSDALIAMAIKHRAPLALVPCCHTIDTARMGYQPHALSGWTAEAVEARVQHEKQQSKQQKQKHEQILATVVDDVRCQTLRNVGYTVEEVLLPETFTPRNRLLLGTPPMVQRREVMVSSTSVRGGGAIVEEDGDATKEQLHLPPIQRMPPLAGRIPLADNPASIAHCHAMMSGKEEEEVVLASATTTGRTMPYVSHHLSLWLPLRLLPVGTTQHGTSSSDKDDGSAPLSTSVAILQEYATQACGAGLGGGVSAGERNNNNNDNNQQDIHLQCTVEPMGEEHVQAITGRRSQLYRFKYTTSSSHHDKLEGRESRVARASRTAAQRLHTALRERIVETFGENVLR